MEPRAGPARGTPPLAALSEGDPSLGLQIEHLGERMRGARPSLAAAGSCHQQRAAAESGWHGSRSRASPVSETGPASAPGRSRVLLSTVPVLQGCSRRARCLGHQGEDAGQRHDGLRRRHGDRALPGSGSRKGREGGGSLAGAVRAQRPFHHRLAPRRPREPAEPRPAQGRDGSRAPRAPGGPRGTAGPAAHEQSGHPATADRGHSCREPGLGLGHGEPPSPQQRTWASSRAQAHRPSPGGLTFLSSLVFRTFRWGPKMFCIPKAFLDQSLFCVLSGGCAKLPSTR